MDATLLDIVTGMAFQFSKEVEAALIMYKNRRGSISSSVSNTVSDVMRTSYLFQLWSLPKTILKWWHVFIMKRPFSGQCLSALIDAGIVQTCFIYLFLFNCLSFKVLKMSFFASFASLQVPSSKIAFEWKDETFSLKIVKDWKNNCFQPWLMCSPSPFPNKL